MEDMLLQVCLQTVLYLRILYTNVLKILSIRLWILLNQFLRESPPELSADIIDTGIYLTGGSSAINRLGELINGETELHVNIADNPSECVVKGIKTIIDDEKYNEIAYIPKDRIID